MEKFTSFILIFLINVLFTAPILYGQITFEKTFEEFNSIGVDIEETPDNGYILLTRHDDLSGVINFLIKTNEFGELIWAKTFDLGLNNICISDEWIFQSC